MCELAGTEKKIMGLFDLTVNDLICMDREAIEGHFTARLVQMHGDAMKERFGKDSSPDVSNLEYEVVSIIRDMETKEKMLRFRVTAIPQPF